METPSCDWSECFSRSGKKFYYNSRTTVSQWEIPPEYIAFKKYQERYSSYSAVTTNNHYHQGNNNSNNNNNNNNHHGNTTPSINTAAGADTTVAMGTNHRHGTPHTGLLHTPVPAVSRRPSLNNHISREEGSSAHEEIPSPSLKVRQGNHQNTPLTNSKSEPSPNSSPGRNKLGKLLNSSLDSADYVDLQQKQDIIRTKFLDTASINLLTNQAADLLERQARQVSDEARRVLDVDLLRTITECANLRAVEKVHSLRSLNIEYKLQTLQEHIQWLEDGTDFT